MENFFTVEFFVTAFFLATLILVIWYLLNLKNDVQVKIELSKYPLGLPKGTVRAILTLLIVGACLLIISSQGDATPEPIKSTLLAVAAFYFGQRTGDINASNGSGNGKAK